MQAAAAENLLVTALGLPQPEVPKFSGSITDYRMFTMAFDARVSSRTISCADRLYYLHQHLIGEPREIVEGCLLMDPDLGYVEARRLLDKEYGDPYKLSMVYIQKIQEWPTLKAGDNSGLKQFALFLKKCSTSMKGISYLSVLNHPPNMLTVVQKLPYYLQNNWLSHVSKMQRNLHKIMGFDDLVDFVEMSSETVNDPVYGQISKRRETARSQDNSQSKHSDKSRQKNAFATNVGVSRVGQESNVSCPMFNQYHDLEECTLFQSKTVDQRRGFWKEKR